MVSYISKMSSKHSLIEVFSDESVTGGVAFKNKSLKKSIINALDTFGTLTIAELAQDLNLSTPKITTLINDLIQDGLIQDLGKINSTGGRRASIYGLVNNACYFLGVDVKRYYLNIGLLDFTKQMTHVEEKIPYRLENTPNSLHALLDAIRSFMDRQAIDKEKILGIDINLSGRINNILGYSYSYFHFQESPLADYIQKELGIKTFLENDSNAMSYGEFCSGVVENEKNVLFINLDYGTGSGIIIDGKVYYGKSGFSGEFGHIPFYHNEILCVCGKKGCLETEVSGQALIEMVKQKIAEGSSTIITQLIKNIDELKLEDIIEAALNEDVLIIELLAEMGDKLGRAISVLINIFNPELVILGGPLAATGDYLRLPVRSALNKYSLSLVNSDTQVKLSKLGEKTGVIGACLIARKKVLSTVL